MLDQITGHLRCSGDDGIEETLAAGCVQSASEQARGRGIATFDRGGGQQYLAYQLLAWRQVAEGRCPQVLLDAMVIAGREPNLGQQQPAARGGQIAGQLRWGARIAKREAQQRLLLVGAGEQRRTGCRGQDRRADPTVVSALRTYPRAAQICAGPAAPGIRRPADAVRLSRALVR